MSTLVHGPEVVQWVTQRLGVPSTAYGANARGLGVAGPRGLRAGVVYGPGHRYNLHAHIASDGSRRWLDRRFLCAMFALPFEVMGAARLTVSIDAANEAAGRFVQHLGFRICALLPESSNSGGDLMIYQMARRECPWLDSH